MIDIHIYLQSCALGYYSFGHELGHNFGAQHNKETNHEAFLPYGRGHLIQQGGSASEGYRTILAYYATGHATRVNYYSNPSVRYPVTGTPTGVAGQADNARVFRENIATFAELGDESAYCPTAPTTTTTTTTTTSTSTTTSTTTTTTSTTTVTATTASNGLQVSPLYSLILPMLAIFLYSN